MTKFRSIFGDRARRRVTMAVAGTLVLLGSSLLQAAPASADVIITRAEFAELLGDEIRLRGTGAVPNADIFVDDIAFPLGAADEDGDFRIRETGFVPTPSCTVTVSDGVTQASATLAGCTVQPPIVNAAPVADAGPDQIFFDVEPLGSQVVTLDGSVSTDDAGIASYRWTEDGTEVISGVNAVVSVSLSVGRHALMLTVVDDFGLTDTDFVVVDVIAAGNRAPVAVAGENPEVAVDHDGNGLESVTLDGSLSDDSDGVIDTYSWTYPGGEIVASGAGTPGLLTLDLGVGIHPLTLTVVDDMGASGSDQVVVSVDPNPLPIARAGGDFQVETASSVILDGSGSSDPGGSIVSYVWREGGTIIGSTAVAMPTPTLETGEHVITLTVTDNAGSIGQDSVIVTVGPIIVPNVDPIADAGPDQIVANPDGTGTQTVILDGSASADSDGPITSYVWHEGLGTLASGTGQPSPLNDVVALGLGTHIVTLTVFDGDGASSSADVSITVVANVGPVANAGPPRIATDFDLDNSETVILNGSASEDLDGTIVSYTWSFGSLPLPEVVGMIVPDVPLPLGTHTVTLTVVDNGGAIATDTVVISVVAPVPDPTGDIVITRAELSKGDRLRVEGQGALPGDEIWVDGQFFGDVADGAGEFRIRRNGFTASGLCVVTVVAGTSVAVADLDGC